LKIAR